MSSNSSLSLAPNPQKKPSSGRPWTALILILLLAGGGAWFWLARDPERRDEVLHTARETMTTLTNKAEQLAQSVTGKGTSGENVAPGQTGAQTGSQTGAQTGTQAGTQTGTQTGGSPQTPSKTPGTPEPADTTTADTRPTPPDTPDTPDTPKTPGTAQTDVSDTRTLRGLVTTDPSQAPPDAGGRTDDAVVRVAFITDLARWMVDKYTPPTSRAGRGTLAIGIQSANARYGAGMKGLAWIGDDLPAGRTEALKHVYSPNMLNALYRMYIDRFMQAMAESADTANRNGKALEPAQIAEMYRLYAGRFRALAGAMQGVASVSNLRSRMTRLHAAAQVMVTANAHYMEEVFKFDQAREKRSEQAVDNARRAMEKASDAYRQTTVERENLRADLIAAIRNNPEARSFGDDNLLFVANWIDRRLQQSPFALEASQQAAALLRDLAQRFDMATGQLP